MFDENENRQDKNHTAFLYMASVSYIIGAIAHFFGLTLFPWYVAELYSPYHDKLIPLLAITITMFIFSIAKKS